MLGTYYLSTVMVLAKINSANFRVRRSAMQIFNNGSNHLVCGFAMRVKGLSKDPSYFWRGEDVEPANA